MCLIRGGLLPLVLGGILVLLSLFTVEASLMGKGLGELLQEFLLEFQSKKIMQSFAFVNKKNFINFSGNVSSEFFKNSYQMTAEFFKNSDQNRIGKL